jgi:hypothetical protein
MLLVKRFDEIDELVGEYEQAHGFALVDAFDEQQIRAASAILRIPFEELLEYSREIFGVRSSPTQTADPAQAQDDEDDDCPNPAGTMFQVMAKIGGGVILCILIIISIVGIIWLKH